MTLSFACTYDDFVEAHKIHRRPARSDRSGLGERLLFLWILLGVFVVLLTLAIVEGTIAAVRGTGPTIDLVATDWAVAILAPWMAWVIATGLLWYAIAGVLGPKERRPARQMVLLIALVHLANLTVTLILSGGPEAVRAREAAAATQAAADEVPWFVSLLPWITIFFLIWVYIFRYLRGMLRRHWNAQPHLRLPNTLEQTERGLRFEDERGVIDYRWSAFPKFREGEGLFLLYISDVSFHMIPKRALPGPGQVEAFRQLLEQHVPNDGAIPARFPMHQPVPVASGALPTRGS